MATRNGLQAFARGVHYLCRLYAKWSLSMIAAINAFPDLTSEQKTTVINALNAVNAACEAFELVRIIYE